MHTVRDTSELSRASGLQVKFGCQQRIHDRGPCARIHQKLIGAGMVDDHRHDNFGPLYEVEGETRDVSGAVRLRVERGKDYGSKTHESHALDYRHWQSLSRIWLGTLLPLFPATSMSCLYQLSHMHIYTLSPSMQAAFLPK